MRLLLCAIALTLNVGLVGDAFCQTVEVALRCEDARKKMEALIVKTDKKDLASITAALKTAVLTSCTVPEGKVVCYQCIDKTQRLRALELLHDTKNKKFKILGFGCRCRSLK